MIVLPKILETAIIAGLVVFIIAIIADYFVKQAGFDRRIVWAIALLAWLAWTFLSGTVSFR